MHTCRSAASSQRCERGRASLTVLSLVSLLYLRLSYSMPEDVPCNSPAMPQHAPQHICVMLGQKSLALAGSIIVLLMTVQG